jgi:asparagine synthase (glutamine-hydrolysing)
MSATDGAWVTEFGAVKGIDLWPGRSKFEYAGDSGRRHLRVVSNPPTWRPQFAEAAAQCVLFDGIVRNRKELEQHLSIGRAKVANDADLVLAAYLAWGENAWQHINGRFAILVWDRDRDQLLCVRDPLGSQPLFFAETAGSLILSPCIRSLQSHPDVTADLNRASLVDYLARRCLNSEETYFRQVRRVLPGHFLRAGPDGGSTIRYWDPVPTSGVIEWVPDDEVQAKFDALLEQSVMSATEGGPAGVFLSGGLDSAAIAVAASDLCSHDGAPAPRAFSFAFPDPFGEQTVQRGVAARLGMEQKLLSFDDVISSGTVLTSGMALSASLPAPLISPWGPMYLQLLLEATRTGCLMMLTGEGGDELLGVPPQVAADLLRAGDIGGLYRLWRAYANYYPEVSWASPAYLVARYGVKPLLKRQRPIFRKTIVPEPWIAPDPALRAVASTRLLDHRARQDDGQVESAYVTALRGQFNAPQQWLRAEESFVLGRLGGIPIRDPFWNTDLIEFMIHVRPLARQRNGVPKAMIRERLSQRFPGLGFEQQQKKIVGNFIQSMTRTEIERALMTFDGNWVLDDLGVIDSRQMRRAADKLTGPKGWRVWDILNLESWLRANY